jgi:probable phosphoglycerate mutase
MSARGRICVARHGETDWNSTGILQGWIDVPLNDKGRLQGQELAGLLAHWHFAKVYSSPLRRAAETAEIIAHRLRLPPPTLVEGLKERNFGAVQGRPKAELALTHPGLMEEIVRRNPACICEQGEAPDHFADRVLAAMKEIAEKMTARPVLVIAHGWVMDVITRHINHLPRDAILKLKRKNIESVWIEVHGHSTLHAADERTIHGVIP